MPTGSTVAHALWMEPTPLIELKGSSMTWKLYLDVGIRPRIGHVIKLDRS